MSIVEINPDTHFHKALEFLRLSNYQSALESINLAIICSLSKDFYMFQKVKILFVAQMFPQCSDYIAEHLKTLYQNSPLYIFSQILYYYQCSSNCSTLVLEDLLATNNIPSVLAHEFPFFINHPDINLLEKIISTKESNDYSTCIDYCDLLLNNDPSDLTVQLIKAKCHTLLGDYDLGISTYNHAITLSPNTPSIYSELGTVFLSLKEYPRAISYFEKALDLAPSNISLVNQLAESFYLWKKYDSALIYFKKILSVNPHCHETLLRIAATYEYTNRPKKAKKYYKKVLAVTKCL